MFVRFVAGTDSQNADWLSGIFMVAHQLRDDGEFEHYEAERFNEVYEWFNRNLPVPPFEKNLRRRTWTKNAVCWFRDDAKEVLDRMWEIVALLREHGVQVRFVQAEKPGKVVYEDEYQIVAEPVNWTHL